MSDVLNSQAPPINEPLGNSQEARNPDGSIKDTQTPPNPSQTDPKTETKPADTKVDDKKPDDKPAGAPEKYEFKAPEGKELSPELLAEATPLFKELNLTNEQGQKLVDFYNKSTESITSKLADTVAEMRNGWRDTIAKSKDIGNGTDNLSDTSKKAVSDAIASMGDAKIQSAFKAGLDLTGAGDHPDIIRGFVALGKLISEATLVKGGGPSRAGQTNSGANKPSAAQAMYPNLPSANG